MNRQLVWFRDDLRAIDNPALHYASKDRTSIIDLAEARKRVLAEFKALSNKNSII